MKKSFASKVYLGLSAFLIVLLVAISVFLLVKFCYIESAQEQIETRLTSIENTLQDNASTEYDNRSIELADEVSLALGIISAGIGVFAIFGGVLSILNIWRSKELENAISTTAKMTEDQRELASARLVQEGRVYAMRNRSKYAVDSFNRAILNAPESVAALSAEYELIALYADALPSKEENITKIQEKVDALVEKLDRLRVLEGRLLKADAYFTLGCFYGGCYLEGNRNSADFWDKSEFYFKKAIKCDKANVDFYRNLAITYALTNDVEKCQENLRFAIYFSESEPLYATLVDSERLSKLFSPYWKYLSKKMKNMLCQEYGVHLS